MPGAFAPALFGIRDSFEDEFSLVDWSYPNAPVSFGDWWRKRGKSLQKFDFS
jgi:hypothetical protein